MIWPFMLSTAYADEDDLLHGFLVFQRVMANLNREQRFPLKQRVNTDNRNWRHRKSESEPNASSNLAVSASTGSAPCGCHKCGEMGHFINKCLH